MRKILFRGKSEHNGNWVYGGIYNHTLVNAQIVTVIGGCFAATPIDADTAGQFTGLLDKNGVKIFEGDIIRYFVPEDVRDRYETDNFGCEGRGYSFVWDTVVGAFHTYSIEYGSFGEIIPDREDQYCNSYYDDHGLTVGEISEDYVVVGNVYDNPELIGDDSQ